MERVITKENKGFISCGFVAAALAVIIGTGLFIGHNVADAEATNTNTQVTVTYYTGKPSTLASYEQAYLDGDSGVNKVTYTTKSLGRLQWGEKNADGTYDVYYDASDIHTLAAHLNESEANYVELYDSYVAAYKAVMQ